ncbi:MAG: Ldh family oxidoreductase [Pseudomonadota bacterium]
MPDVTLDTIETTTQQALMVHGAAEWIAASVARAVRRAEETGNVICGLYYLESYCLQLRSGRVNGVVEPIVSRPRPGAVKSDAGYGFAQPAFDRALPEAVTAAHENGVAALAVAHAHTCTSLGYFTEGIATQGLLGLGFTNASPIVAPPGGKNRIIGTNPIAFSVPDSHGGLAIHVDQSTTTVALGKITMAKAAGEAIPEGWAVDAEGRPTTDPDAALAGSLVSLGGVKGWGFGIMAEIMAAAMTGSVNSLDVAGLKHSAGDPHGLGQFYLLLDPGTFSNGFLQRLERLSAAVEQDAGTRLPGSKRRSLNPVAVPDALWDTVQGLAG